MSTAAPARRPDLGSSAAAVPVADRGGTRIADRVYAKIAARAALEALHAGAGGAGRKGGARPAAPGGQAAEVRRSLRRLLREPNASVEVRARHARVHLSLELPYPVDVAALTARVRTHVSERVAELTRTPVSEVTLVVERLVSPAAEVDVGRVR